MESMKVRLAVITLPCLVLDALDLEVVKEVDLEGAQDGLVVLLDKTGKGIESCEGF